MRRAFAALLALGTLAHASGDVVVFQMGTSRGKIETVMAEAGAPWFQQWLVDQELIGAVMDQGFTNFVVVAIDTAKGEAIEAAVGEVVGSNVVWQADALQAAVDTLTPVLQSYAESVAGATGTLVRTQAQGDTASAIATARGLITTEIAATAAAKAQAEIAAAKGTIEGWAGAVTDGKLVNYSTTAQVNQAVTTASGADRLHAEGLVDAHADILASTEAPGHVQLGSGLYTADGKVHTIVGSFISLPAAAALSWDASTAASFHINTPLAANATFVTIENMVVGIPYTLTVKTGAQARGFSFTVDGLNMRALAGSMSTLTIPANSALVVTLQADGTGDVFYSTGPAE